LGILVTKPTNLYGDNFDVIQSATSYPGRWIEKETCCYCSSLCLWIDCSRIHQRNLG
jgi:hypothetical protein